MSRHPVRSLQSLSRVWPSSRRGSKSFVVGRGVTRLADAARPAGPAIFSPIIRPRISQRIDAAAAGRIILIVAPAGYGKSLALSHWLDCRQRPYLRFDVHAEHNTLLGFARGIAEAFSQLPALRKTVATAFQNSASAAAPGHEMARWMAAHLEGFDGIIAIDDFHRASEDIEVSRFVASLIARTKAQIQWVLATRSTLDLPVASWLAYGDAHFVIGDRDLTFLDDETLELSQGAGQALSARALRGVMDATSGWPVALGLALRSASVLSGGADLSHSTREVLFQYLAEQVYAELLPEERELLHFAAYLPSVDVSVLEVAGYHTGARVLESVRRRATFLSLESPGRYACHDLFREFLRGQIELTDPAEAKRLQEKAASALERSGDVVAALRLYAQMHAADVVLRLLRENGFSLMDHSHGDAVESALRAVPPHTRSSDAIILGLRAQRAADSGHFDRAEALFKSALDFAEDPDVLLTLAISLAVLLRNQSRSVNEALGSLDTSAGRLELRAEIAALLATDSALSNDQDRAKGRVAVAERFCPLIESQEVRAKLLLRIGIAKMTIGYPTEDVLSGLSEAASLAESIGMLGIAARAYNVLGMAQLFYLNSPDETLKSETKGAIAAVKSADRFALQAAIAYSITAETNLGNEAALEPLLSRLSEAAISDAERLRSIRSYTRATLCAWNAQLKEAAILMEDLASSDYGYYDFDRLFNMASHALFAAGAGDIPLSRKLLATIAQRSNQCKCPHPYGKAKWGVATVFSATAEYFGGRRQRARAFLKALPLNSPGPVLLLAEVLSLFFQRDGDWSDDVSSLIGSISREYTGVARTLEVSLKYWAALHAERAGAIVALTPAERRVLMDLDDGESPKEIAARTGRSVHTVRTLIQRAMQKLGCQGRHEALATARRTGVFTRGL